MLRTCFSVILCKGPIVIEDPVGNASISVEPHCPGGMLQLTSTPLLSLHQSSSRTLKEREKTAGQTNHSSSSCHGDQQEVLPEGMYAKESFFTMVVP